MIRFIVTIFLFIPAILFGQKNNKIISNWSQIDYIGLNDNDRSNLSLSTDGRISFTYRWENPFSNSQLIKRDTKYIFEKKKTNSFFIGSSPNNDFHKIGYTLTLRNGYSQTDYGISVNLFDGEFYYNPYISKILTFKGSEAKIGFGAYYTTHTITDHTFKSVYYPKTDYRGVDIVYMSSLPLYFEDFERLKVIPEFYLMMSLFEDNGVVRENNVSLYYGVTIEKKLNDYFNGYVRFREGMGYDYFYSLRGITLGDRGVFSLGVNYDF
jgi:hypothetical protein